MLFPSTFSLGLQNTTLLISIYIEIEVEKYQREETGIDMLVLRYSDSDQIQSTCFQFRL